MAASAILKPPSLSSFHFHSNVNGCPLLDSTSIRLTSTYSRFRGLKLTTNASSVPVIRAQTSFGTCFFFQISFDSIRCWFYYLFVFNVRLRSRFQILQSGSNSQVFSLIVFCWLVNIGYWVCFSYWCLIFFFAFYWWSSRWNRPWRVQKVSSVSTDPLAN